MTQEMLIMAAILVAVILLTFIGILSRYRKCKSDEVLVVYGKTGGEKKSAKLYHGGAAFVWPIIQGYEFLSMKPMQIDCKLTGALSAQNIRVDVPTTITVAISTDAEVMQNAAERMLGLTMDDKQNLITDVVYGQMRLVIADMTIEELNSDRDKFLSKVKDNIDTELRKFGLYLMNINISDIRDAANYIVNLGKEAESKAQNEAQANIEEQEKLGAIKIATQIKERETKVAETRKDQGYRHCRNQEIAGDICCQCRQGQNFPSSDCQRRERSAGCQSRSGEKYPYRTGKYRKGKPHRRTEL